FALAAAVIPLAVAAFYVRILARLLEAVMWGLQRMDVSNVVAVSATALQLAGTVWVLQAGYGLVGLVIVRGIVALASVALLGIALARMLPALRIGPGALRRASFGTLLRYGSKIQVTKLAELAYVQGDKLFLGYFVGLPAVAFYELASRLVQGARFLSVIVTSAVVPVASELDAGGEKEALRLLYRRASKYLVLVAAPLNLFPAVLAPWLVLSWLGAGYNPVVVLLQALAVGHFVHVLTASGTTLVQGIGLPEVETRFALLLLAINVVLSFVLIGRFGFSGVLFATPLALIVGSIYFWWSLKPIVGVRLPELWGQIYAFPTIVCLLMGGLVYATGVRLSQGTLAGGHRWEAVVITLGVGLGMTVAYGLIVWTSAYLDAYDRRLLSGVARQLFGVRT
ncbi:MAG: oligosaccharide flippase family protein, partial [Chloroflexi bacterium]|nr:oligosaccharide flippase family protein [Chloroflexota bacterium]